MMSRFKKISGSCGEFQDHFEAILTLFFNNKYQCLVQVMAQLHHSIYKPHTTQNTNEGPAHEA